MTVYEKLINIQSELKAPKSQYNSFGKYKYRNCEDILESVKPLLEKNRSTLFISDEVILIGSRFYVKSTVTFVDAESGEKIINTAYAREEENKKGMDGSQITGASSSYARKYALNGMFAIDDTKDSDTTNTGSNSPIGNNGTSQGLSEAQVKRLYAIAYKAGVKKEDVALVVKHDYGISDVAKLTKNQYDEICERLEKKGSK